MTLILTLRKVISKVGGYIFFDVLIKLLPFCILPILASTLSIKEFKTVSLYVMMISFFLTLLPLGVTTKILMIMAGNASRNLNLPSALLPTFILSSLIFLIVLLMDIELMLSKKEILLLLMVGFNMAVGQVLAVRFQAEQRSILYGAVMLSLHVSFYFPMLISNVLFAGNDTFFLQCICFQSLIILVIFFLETSSTKSRYRLSFKDFRVYWIFVFSIFAHIAVNAVRFVYDRLYLSEYADDASFVYYNVALQSAMVLSVLCVSGNRFWTTFYFSNKNDITIKHYILNVLLLIILSVCVYGASYFYITYFFPEQYRVALTLVPMLLGAFFIQGLYLLFSARLYSLRRFKTITFSSVFSLCVSIVIIEPLFVRFGDSGAALSLLISWAVLLLLSQGLCLFKDSKERVNENK